MVSASAPQSYTCQHCLKRFKSHDSRLHHMSRYHGYAPVVYACDQCPKSFKYKHEYIVHLSEVHKVPNMKFECGQCASSFKHEHHLVQHYKLVHDPNRKLYNCKECSKVFERRDGFAQHMKRVHSSAYTLHRCEICYRIYRTKASLRLHVNMNHNENFQRSYCPLCPADFKWPHHLKQHISKVHMQQNIPSSQKSKINRCTICLLIFKDKLDMLLHMRREHNLDINIFKCCQCTAVFNLEESLLRHLEIHEERKGDHKCEQCHPVLKPMLYVGNDEQNVSDDYIPTPADEIIDFEVSIMEDPDLRQLIKYKMRHMRKNKLFFEAGYFKENYNNESIFDEDLIDNFEENDNLQYESEVNVTDEINKSQNSDKTLEKTNTPTDWTCQFTCIQCSTSFASAKSLLMHDKVTHSKDAAHDETPSKQNPSTSFPETPTADEVTFSESTSSPKINISSNQISQMNLNAKHLVIQLHRVNMDESNNSLKKIKSDQSMQLQRHIYMSHKCKRCTAVFNDIASLRVHRKEVHMKSLLYKCEICNRIFASKVRLDKHMDSHEINMLNDLNAAIKVSATAVKVSAVRQKRVAPKLKMKKKFSIIKCKRCNMKFNTPLEIARHVRFFHLKGRKNYVKDSKDIQKNSGINKTIMKKYKCKQCPMAFVEMQKLAVHSRVYHKGKLKNKCLRNTRGNNAGKHIFGNDEMNSNSNDLNTFNSIGVNVNKAGPSSESVPQDTPTEAVHKCDSCERFFASKLSLNRHINKKHMCTKDIADKTDTIFICALCEHNFPTKKDMILHIKNHAVKELHKCVACNVVFEDESELTQHFKMLHRHKCGICNMSYVHKDKLLHHLETQHGERSKQHRCDECNTVFRLAASLANHIDSEHKLIISKEDKLTSAKSPKVITKKMEMGMHKCENCSALFPFRASLERHFQLEHCVGSVHKCGVCTAMFNDMEEFKEHFHIEHNMNN